MGALIYWQPIEEDFDDSTFPYSDEEGWVPVDAWKGVSAYDQEQIYTLELVEKVGDGEEVERRGILWKFDGLVALILTEDDIADAAQHIGFDFFRTEPMYKGSEGVWIIKDN